MILHIFQGFITTKYPPDIEGYVTLKVISKINHFACTLCSEVSKSPIWA